MITIRVKSEVKTLYTSMLRFDGVIRIVEKYWKSGPSSVYISKWENVEVVYPSVLSVPAPIRWTNICVE